MQLPQIKDYDIACPECRSTENISIAGVTAYPRSPEEWYCHCRACKKGYSPRKKEGSGMTPFEPLPVESQKKKDRLNKEKYLTLKEQGWSDARVIKEYGFRNDPEFYSLKNKWGLKGVRIDKPKVNPVPIEPEPDPKETGTVEKQPDNVEDAAVEQLIVSKTETTTEEHMPEISTTMQGNPSETKEILDILKPDKVEDTVSGPQPIEEQPREHLVKEQITKEKYLELKADGYSDARIISEYGFRGDAEFYAIKKFWGLKGVRLDKHNGDSQTVLNQVVKQSPSPDGIDWVTPGMKQTPVEFAVQVSKGNVYFFGGASDAFLQAGHGFVQIGARNGQVVIKGHAQKVEKVNYKLHKDTNSPNARWRISGVALVPELEKRGIIKGKYRLEQQGELWIGTLEGEVADGQ
jgi:hypothetical protein